MRRPIANQIASLAAALGLALLAGAGSARAGDFARTEILGFSPDGRHFAFEEYGIQDGSGFPYSNIYIIETDSDRWVPGSPFRQLDEIDDSRPVDFAAELAETRIQNRARAQGLLASTGIAGQGDTVAHNPPNERGADPLRLSATTHPQAPDIGPVIELQLSEYPLASANDCPDGFGTIQGFRLTLFHDGAPRILNADTTLPASRGCPLRYRLERLVLHRQAETDAPRFAILVLMERIGFEGPDGRYLAITGRL